MNPSALLNRFRIILLFDRQGALCCSLTRVPRYYWGKCDSFWERDKRINSTYQNKTVELHCPNGVAPEIAHVFKNDVSHVSSIQEMNLDSFHDKLKTKSVMTSSYVLKM